MAEKKSKMTLELVDKVSEKLKKIDNELYRSSHVWGKRAEKMNKFGGALDNMGTKGLTGTTALAGGLLYASKMASNYNTEINKLAVMSNLSKDGIDKLKDSIERTGKQTGIAKVDMANLYRQLGQAGVGVKELDKIAGASVNVGRILGERDYAAVGGEIVNTLNSVGVAYKDVDKFLDKATISTNISNQTLADNFQTIQKSGAIFKAAVPDANKYQAIIASLAQKGLNGAEAGTMLNSTISKVMDNSGKGAKAIEGLGVSLKNSKGEAKDFYDIVNEVANSDAYKKLSNNEKLNFAKEVAGVEHSSRFKALLDSAEEGKLDENKKKIQDSGNAFKNFAETIAPLTKIFDRMKASLSNMVLDIGDALAKNPEVIKTVEGWANSLEKLGDKVKAFANSEKGKAVLAEVVKLLPKLVAAFAGMKIVGKGAKSLGSLFETISKFQRYRADGLYKTVKDLKKLTKEIGEDGIDWDKLSQKQQKMLKKAFKLGKKGKIDKEDLPEIELGEVKAGKFKKSLGKLKTLGKDVGSKIGTNISRGIAAVPIKSILKTGGWAALFTGSLWASNKMVDKFQKNAPKKHQKIYTDNGPKKPDISANVIKENPDLGFGRLTSSIGDKVKELDDNIDSFIGDSKIFNLGKIIEEGLSTENISGKFTEVMGNINTWLNEEIPDYPIFHLGDQINQTMSNAQGWVAEKWGNIKSTLGQTVRGKVDMLRTAFEQGYHSVRNKWQDVTTRLRTKINGKVGMIWDSFKNAAESISKKWDRLKNKLSSGISGVISITKNVIGGALDGSFDTGLPRVPRDNFVANLHKDEMVLTKRQADKLRSGRLGGNSTNVVNHININAKMDNSLDVEDVARTIARHLKFA